MIPWFPQAPFVALEMEGVHLEAFLPLSLSLPSPTPL